MELIEFPRLLFYQNEVMPWAVQNARYVVHGKLSAVNECLKERY